MRTVSLWPMRAIDLNFGNPWVIEGEAGVKNFVYLLHVLWGGREGKEEERWWWAVCFLNLKGKEYSMSGVPPIVNLWRISWLAFKTWSSIWAAPAWQGRQQKCEHGFGFLKGVLQLFRHWCSIFPPCSLEMGLKAGASFLVRFLGIEEGIVTLSIKYWRVPAELALNWVQLDPGEKICSWIYEEQS